MLVNPTLTKGSVELLILSLLEEERLYGYEITQLIEGRTRSLLRFRRSSIYPVLSRMEKRGWIQSHWGEGRRRRCYYSLTETGSDALDRQRVEWRVFTTAVNLVVDPGSNGG